MIWKRDRDRCVFSRSHKNSVKKYNETKTETEIGNFLQAKKIKKSYFNLKNLNLNEARSSIL
jgi:hypothetical protein